MENDLVKLARIIKSSDRVQKIRKAVGLRKDEFVRQMTSNYIEIDKTTSKKLHQPGRKVEKIKGMSAMMYILEKAYADIEKDVVEHFGLPNSMSKLACECILHGKTPSDDFRFWYRLDRETGEMTITITLKNSLSSYSRDDLFRRISDVNYLVEEFYRTDNTNGVGTLKNSHHQIKGMQNFDEKFDLTREYEGLRAKYPNGMPKNQQEQLLKPGKIVFGKPRSAYTINDLQKHISEFKKYARGE